MKNKIQRRCITVYGDDALEQLKALEPHGWRIGDPSERQGHQKALRNGNTEILLFVKPDKVMTSNVLPQDYEEGEIPDERDVIIEISKQLTEAKISHDLCRTWT